MLQRIALVFSFVFLTACSSENSYHDFFISLYPKVVKATKLKVLNSDIIENRPIVFPPNTWISLLWFESENQDYCLVFKTPFLKGKVDGVLRLIFMKKGNECNELSALNILSELKLKYLSSSFKSKTDSGEFHPELSFRGEYTRNKKGHSFRIAIPLINLANPKLKQKINKFSSSVKEIYFPGLSISSHVTELVPRNLSQFKFSKDSFCHILDDQCNDKLDYSCDKCPLGLWTEVVGGKCAGKRDKICGDFSCHSSGNPACFRGMNWISDISNCEALMKASFCANELKPICVDGYLFCQ